MKVLVTGAAGFIGSHAAERFQKEGMQVTGIDNFSDYYDVALKCENAEVLQKLGVETLKMDLREMKHYGQLSLDYDFIVHFAAHPGISAGSTFKDYYSNNITGTENILNFAKGVTNLKHFFFISTSSVYGLEATFPETAIPNPGSDYGRTKLEGEKLLLKEHNAGRLNSTILRLFSVYGPRERPDKLYSKLISCGLNNEVFEIFEGSEKHTRSFTYVGDIVEGIFQAVSRHQNLNGEIINLGANEEYTTLEGIRLVEELLGKNIPLKVVAARKGDQLGTSANIEKARRLLGYDPGTSLREGLIKQVEWFKQFEELKMMKLENELL